MTAFTVASIIAITIIGLIVVAELIAVLLLALGVRNLTREVRDRINPVVDQSTKLMRKVNDVADSVKTSTAKVTDSVTSVTEKLSTRVDSTTAQAQGVASSALRTLASPPFVTAIAVLAGLRLAATVQRLLSWPVVTALALLTGIPFGLRAWRNYQQALTSAMVPAAPAAREPLVLRPQREAEPIHHAA